MSVDFAERMRPWRSRPALVFDDVTYTYADILDHYDRALSVLDGKLPKGSVVLLVPQFTPWIVGAFFALVHRGDIVILANRSRVDVVEVDEYLIEVDAKKVQIRPRHAGQKSALIEDLRRSGHAGLAFLSSGTTGTPKVVLHDFAKIAAIFQDGKKSRTTYAFLPFEQIGGFYNLLYVLSGGGVLVCDSDKTPDRVARSIQDHHVQLISCNPSFLRLFYMSGAHTRYNLKGLEQINFGTEPMPESTLKLLAAALPWVKLRQKFGMSEIGIIGASVEAPDSPFIRFDRNICDYRVVDNFLEVKSKTTMLGYLQGDAKKDQFTADGWLRTGDLVETRGEFIRILGRQTDLINVGGRKVMPQEVEEVLQDMSGIVDVVVEAESNAILGQVVKATLIVREPTSAEALRDVVREHCRAKGLDAFKIPQRIIVKPVAEWNAHMKKQRRMAGAT